MFLNEAMKRFIASFFYLFLPKKTIHILCKKVKKTRFFFHHCKR